MTEFNPIIFDESAYTISLKVIITDPNGIKLAIARDRYGIEIKRTDFNCEQAAEFLIGVIERPRLPFTVEEQNCANNDIALSVPLFQPPGEEQTQPGVRLPCSPLFCTDDPNCDTAQTKVTSLQEQFQLKCSSFHVVERKRDVQKEQMEFCFSAALILAAAAAAAAALPIFGAWVAIALAIVAAIIFGQGLLLAASVLYLNSRLTDIEAELEDLKQQIVIAIDDVRSKCCSFCIKIDLEIPTC